MLLPFKIPFSELIGLKFAKFLKTKKLNERLDQEIWVNFIDKGQKIEIAFNSTEEIDKEEFLKICYWYIEKLNCKKELENIKFYEYETSEIKKKAFDSEESILEWI